MFDFDGSKFLIIGIVALLVIGPKDLPRVLRHIGQWTGKLRRMASEFQGQFMDAMRDADLDTIKKDVRSIADTARIDRFDPMSDLRREISGIKSDLRASVSLNKPIVPAAAASSNASMAPAAAHVAAAGSTVTSTATPTTTLADATSEEFLRPKPGPSGSRTPPAPGTLGSLPGRIPLKRSASGAA